MNSKNFDKVAKYYDLGLWDEEKVRASVGKWITEEEFKEITGKDF